MAQCEKCGTTFEPSADRTEVTSLRILCSKCEAERRAEKAARAQAAAAAQAGTRPAAAPAARPAATATPRPAAAATPRPAAAPAARPAPAPAPAPAAQVDDAETRRAQANAPGASRKLAGAPKKPVGTGVRGSDAKKLHGAPSKKLYHKPVKGTDEEHAGENFHPDVQRELRFLQAREGKVMKIAWIVCAVLVVAAGGFAFAAKSKREATAAAAAEKRQRLDAFAEKMLEFDVKTEEGAKKAIDYAEEMKGIGWEDDARAGRDAGSVLTKAKMSLQKLEDEKQQKDRLATVESALRDAASKPVDELLKARRTISSLEELGDAYGTDFAARVKGARGQIDQAVLKRLFEEAASLAKTSGESPEKMRAALAAYTKAEDEATAVLDRVMRQKDEDAKQFYTKEYRAIVDESNAFVTSVFTPEVIERTPWTDLLSPDQKPNWQEYGNGGFRLEKGVLEVAGPPAGSTAHGLIDIPSTGGYRDFVIDMEFTLTKGHVDWLFRLGRRVDNTVESFPTSIGGEAAIQPGTSYRMEAKYIGGKLNVALYPEDVPSLEVESGWTKMRKGAFGAQIKEGVELKITRLKIKLLRAA